MKESMQKEGFSTAEMFEIENREGGIVIQKFDDKLVKRYKMPIKVYERTIERIAIEDKNLEEIQKVLGKTATDKEIYEYVVANKKFILMRNVIELRRDKSCNTCVIDLKVNGEKILNSDRKKAYNLLDFERIETFTNRMFGKDKITNKHLESVIDNIKHFEDIAFGNTYNV